MAHFQLKNYVRFRYCWIRLLESDLYSQWTGFGEAVPWNPITLGLNLLRQVGSRNINFVVISDLSEGSQQMTGTDRSFWRLIHLEESKEEVSRKP